VDDEAQEVQHTDEEEEEEEEVEDEVQEETHRETVLEEEEEEEETIEDASGSGVTSNVYLSGPTSLPYRPIPLQDRIR
jgi:hypothetical protein